MDFKIAAIDHLVLNCSDVHSIAEWYQRALGVEVETYDDSRTALVFGAIRIRLRPTGADGWITRRNEAPGSLDVCFETQAPVTAVTAHWESIGVEVVDGPVQQAGALGRIESVYTRDPDGNLVEVACYI